jgi:hypothetical protein
LLLKQFASLALLFFFLSLQALLFQAVEALLLALSRVRRRLPAGAARCILCLLRLVLENGSSR